MRTASILLAAFLAASASSTLAQQASAPSAGAAPAPAVTPANDPAYTYKTLRLNRAAFDALNARPEQLLVIDLRRPDELTKNGGFPVYFSLQPSDVQRSLSLIPRDRLIVTVSNRAHRAGAVGDILTGLGFHVVGAIGVLDYQDEGGVLTKLQPPPPRVAANAEGAQTPQAAAPAASPTKP
ncbi:sulfurtransferase [Methylocystis bryophila]|uniref:Sulfurtransferase n=1 Tax=Methylocystis bryophila TaxID=655015 RepID=A0A1W6N0L6_9HYPH|nr:sulfurtransferase [Methylocystis bryophila]ARN83382.1 sulfurtransferase [Methylocystis bryophila]